MGRDACHDRPGDFAGNFPVAIVPRRVSLPRTQALPREAEEKGERAED